jgi:hypothetical protein
VSRWLDTFETSLPIEVRLEILKGWLSECRAR